MSNRPKQAATLLITIVAFFLVVTLQKHKAVGDGDAFADSILNAIRSAGKDQLEIPMNNIGLFAKGDWSGICALDYSATERVVELFAEKHDLNIHSVTLAQNYDEPWLWSIVLVKHGAYRQYRMRHKCLMFLKDIGSCTDIKTGRFIFAQTGADVSCSSGAYTVSLN